MIVIPESELVAGFQKHYTCTKDLIHVMHSGLHCACSWQDLHLNFNLPSSVHIVPQASYRQPTGGW